MIKHRACSNVSLVRLLAFLSLALCSAGPTIACSPEQRTQSSGGIVSNEPTGKQLWKFEAGG